MSPVLVLAAAAGALAWAVRGRSSAAFGPNVWRGPRGRRALALTFDDGPSESTPSLLETLQQHGARSTFFQCGMHAERLPHIARSVSRAGHEIGNHSQTHASLYLKPASFVQDEIRRAQRVLSEVHGSAPKWFRAPYGVRWFGMKTAMRELGLTHAAWTGIARDWTLPARQINDRILLGARPGAILCLHDGRESRVRPDIRVTLEAVRLILPRLRDQGFELVTLSELLCPTSSSSA